MKDDEIMKPYESEHQTVRRHNKKTAKRPMSERQLMALADGRAKRDANRLLKANQPPGTVTPTETTPPPATRGKVRKLGDRLWWQVGVGAACFALDVLIGAMYIQNNTNALLAMAFVLVGGTGALFLYLGLRKREEGMQLRPTKEKLKVANCLNIYYGYNEETKKVYCKRIAFEQMPDDKIVSEHPQQCLDDGKWYYVHIYDPNLEKLIPFTLPDQTYYSPREFVNPLQMPMSRKVLKPKPTLGEKLRPVLLLIAMGIIIFAWIVTTPPPAT